MGGSWDSTNTADGDVAVFAPIDIDHADRLGDTIREIAAVKAGIIKTGAAVVSARQDAAADAVLRAAAAERDATIAFEGAEFALTDARLAVGGQLISVRGIAGRLRRRVPAALRRRTRPRTPRWRSPRSSRSSAAAASRSPATSWPRDSRRRAHPADCSWSGSNPTVIVDAAHNPHGARALAAALSAVVRFRRVGSRARRARRQGCRRHRRGARTAGRARVRHRAGLRAGRGRRPDRGPRRSARAARDGPCRRRRRRGVRARVGCGIRSSCGGDRGLRRPRRRSRQRWPPPRTGRRGGASDRSGVRRTATATQPGRSRIARVDRARLRIDHRLPRRARGVRAQGAARVDPAVVGHRRSVRCWRSSCC